MQLEDWDRRCEVCRSWRQGDQKLGLLSGYGSCDAVGFVGDGRQTLNLIETDGKTAKLVTIYTFTCQSFQRRAE